MAEKRGRTAFPVAASHVHEGMVPSFTEREMSEYINEVHELDVGQLECVSGGDMALDLAVKAYEAALGKRLMDAVHQPVTQPTVTLHFS
jgi:hypothetical protein